MNQNMKYKIAAGLLLIVISFSVFAWRSITGEQDITVLSTNKPQHISPSATSVEGSDTVSLSAVEEKQQVLVDVSGAVKRPGVVRLSTGSRVFEAVELAGGTSEEADLRTVNLAAVLKDGQKIYIPKLGEQSEEVVGIGWDPNGNGKLDLNTANAASLQELDGIGMKTAEKIIAYREEHGGFRTVEELMNVSGIGSKTFEGLKDQIAVYE